MKRYFLVLGIILIVFQHSSYAQDPINNSNFLNSSRGSYLFFDSNDTTVEGTPYLNTNFFPAKVSVNPTEIFEVRYNAAADEMEVKLSEDNIQAINKNINGLTVEFDKINKIYKTFTYYNREGENVTGYLLSLSNMNSPVQLYLRESKVFIEAKPAKSSYQAAEKAQYKEARDVHYIAINDKVHYLSPKKKELAKLFPGHEKDVLKYIDSEKLNLKKDEDLLKLTIFLNQLK